MLSSSGSGTLSVMTAKDPILSALAKNLDNVTFSTPTNSDHLDGLKAIGQTKSFKLCYPWVSGGWVVKLYIGGSQRILGKCTNCAQAVRFADMAIWRFWRFKRNTDRGPVPSDFNLGLTQAKFESENESSAKQLLDSIEVHCRAQGYLTFDTDPSNPRIKLPPSTRMKWNLAWAKFKFLSEQMKSELNEQGTPGFAYVGVIDDLLDNSTKVVLTVDEFFRARNLR